MKYLVNLPRICEEKGHDYAVLGCAMQKSMNDILAKIKEQENNIYFWRHYYDNVEVLLWADDTINKFGNLQFYYEIRGRGAKPQGMKNDWLNLNKED